MKIIVCSLNHWKLWTQFLCCSHASGYMCSLWKCADHCLCSMLFCSILRQVLMSRFLSSLLPKLLTSSKLGSDKCKPSGSRQAETGIPNIHVLQELSFCRHLFCESCYPEKTNLNISARTLDWVCLEMAGLESHASLKHCDISLSWNLFSSCVSKITSIVWEMFVPLKM